MSSCAASCCICFPKASSAFATLASSPTGGAPLSSRSVFNYSEQYSHRRPNQKPPLPRNRTHFGSVLPNSNSDLHPLSPKPPHETTNPSPLSPSASPPAGLLLPSSPKPTPPQP